MSTMDQDTGQAQREAKRAEELAAFVPRLSEAMTRTVEEVIANDDVRTLDVPAMGSGIEFDWRAFQRLQRVVDNIARSLPVTGYVVPQGDFMGIPMGWTIVLSPRIPDPRVAELEAEVAAIRALIAERNL